MKLSEGSFSFSRLLPTSFEIQRADNDVIIKYRRRA